MIDMFLGGGGALDAEGLHFAGEAEMGDHFVAVDSAGLLGVGLFTGAWALAFGEEALCCGGGYVVLEGVLLGFYLTVYGLRVLQAM